MKSPLSLIKTGFERKTDERLECRPSCGCDSVRASGTHIPKECECMIIAYASAMVYDMVDIDVYQLGIVQL